MRVLFGEKQKFQKIYSYVFDYLNGLNGFNLNFLNKNSIFYGKKTADYMENLSKMEFIKSEKDLEKKEEKSYIEMDELIHNFDIDNSSISNFLKSLNFYRFDKKIYDPCDLDSDRGN